MKKVLIIGLLGLYMGIEAHGEIFAVDTGHAEIGFSVKHMMVSNTKGTFTSFKGTVDYDMASQTLISGEGSIETTSLNTNNKKRDDHLKNEDFFNVTKYPKITFKSTSVKKTGQNRFEVSGVLNVLGVDRKVVLPVTITGPVDDPWGNKRIGMECTTVLNRRDLGITHSPAAMIGDEVKISIEAEATYQ